MSAAMERGGSRRRWNTTPGLRELIVFVVLALVASIASAATSEYEKHADGLAVYLGVLPAQLIRGPSDGHLATMHGGPPSSGGSHHLVVAIYDERTGKTLDYATVEATVVPLGMGATRRALERMKIADTVSYGNFFPMDVPGPYVIRVAIRREGQSAVTEVQFNYAHPR